MTFAGFFVQDDFRVSRRLTLNLGVRWDVFTHPHDVFNRQSNFNLSDGLIHLATDGNSGPEVDTYYKNLAPRVGFAYTPDSGKTALRGSYGISYFPDNFGATGGTLERNYPFFATSQISAASTFVPNLNVNQGFPGNAMPEIVNNTVSPPAGFAVFRIPQKLPPGYGSNGPPQTSACKGSLRETPYSKSTMWARAEHTYSGTSISTRHRPDRAMSTHVGRLRA